RLLPQRGADRGACDRGDLGGQRAGADQVGELGRRVRGETAADLSLVALAATLDDWGGEDVVVQEDRDLRERARGIRRVHAEGGIGDLGPLLRPGGVEVDVDGDLTGRVSAHRRRVHVDRVDPAVDLPVVAGRVEGRVGELRCVVVTPLVAD